MLRSVLLALVASPWLFAAPIPRDAPKVNYFPLAKGTVWNYTTAAGDDSAGFAISVEDSTETNGRTTATLKYQFDGSSLSEQMAADGAGVYRPGEKGFEKPVLVLKYPLAVGSSWDSKMPLGGASPEAKATVQGIVDVVVPAGKFKAMEVRFVSADDKNTLTAWYALNVGVIKQTTVYDGRATTIELTKFSQGK